MHVPTDDKSNDTKDSFHEELERVLNQCRAYDTKLLLGHFNAKGGMKSTLKQADVIEGLRDTFMDNRL
jgi:hypothetical protein